ncbi:MAG TPA: precorrin-6A/cobalt-precorrin-6A reductase [Dongiaceae bacterium]
MPISPIPDTSKPDILILGETIEATDLAEALQTRPDCAVMTPGDIAAPVLDQMASTEGLASLLRSKNIRLLVNAANAYDTDLNQRSLAAAIAVDVPILRLMRPAWQRDPLDSWIDVASVAAAADICRWYGKRILVTLGESDLSPFAGNDRCHFLIRLPSPPAQPLDLAHHDLIIGRGPFAWLDERRLMMEQQVDLLVSRNIGGLDSYAKIDVARDLAIPVVMITRPTPTQQPHAETLAQALTWIDAWRRTEEPQTVDNRRSGEQKATTAESE